MAITLGAVYPGEVWGAKHLLGQLLSVLLLAVLKLLLKLDRLEQGQLWPREPQQAEVAGAAL